MKTLIPELDPQDPLHKVVLKGEFDPAGQAMQAWFEWGADRNSLSNRTGPVAVSGGRQTVSALVALPADASVGVTYYYRAVLSDGTRSFYGDIVDFTILLGDPKAVSNPKWSIYDRLIKAYADRYRIPATILKAVMVQESSLNKHAFRYEPMVYESIRKETRPNLEPYRLPANPPSENEYPREYWRNAPWKDDTSMVRLPLDITMGELWEGYKDRISMTKPRADNWGKRAQWRVTSSYGLGQLLYAYHGDKINWSKPEALYDPYLNVEATARNLANPTCRGDFSDFSLEGMSRAVLHHNWGPMPCNYPSIAALRAACQGRWCSRRDLWRGENPAYLVSVANWLPEVRPALVRGADTRGILPPPAASAGAGPLLPLTLGAVGAGETELDRLIADFKGTGQPQLAVLYGIGDGLAMEGVLRIFTDTEGSLLEWESPPMPGITPMGAIYTQTLGVGGAPLIVASWGVGAHGTVAYFFRWQGGQFREISVEEGGITYTGAFADAFISVDAQGLSVAQRGSEEPLAVTILSTYSWQDERAAFTFDKREVISPIPFRLYLPFVIRSAR